MGIADVKQHYVYPIFAVDNSLLFLCIPVIQFICIYDNMKIIGTY